MPAAVADIINGFFEGIVEILDFLLSWLPDSPFQEPIEAIKSSLGSELLGYINYFLPISEMLSITSVWVASIVAYYAISTVLRWTKAIS